MKIILKLVYIMRAVLYLPLRVIIKIGDLYSYFLKTLDKKNHDTFWQEIMQKSIDSNVSHSIKISSNTNEEIKFYCPSKIASYRVKTLFTKEPETIDWINNFGSEKNCLYDIGANMGIYSIYYAKKFKSRVYAFEPSFRNLDLLSKNIRINLLEKYIFLIPNALSEKFMISDFFQMHALAGKAEATFNDEKIKNSIVKANNKLDENDTINYKTLGFSIDNLIDLNLIEKPNLIKIDVDGNEINILNGCKKTIQSIEKISILIETRKETHEIIESELKKLGLKKINQFVNNSIWKK
tara:strand:+ start:188 stop:1072 length:885 start_codon:yes stop_codon:yes gene_type:complete